MSDKEVSEVVEWVMNMSLQIIQNVGRAVSTVWSQSTSHVLMF